MRKTTTTSSNQATSWIVIAAPARELDKSHLHPPAELVERVLRDVGRPGRHRPQ
jgi:hypothetical protein